LDPITFFSNGERWFIDHKPASGLTLTQNLYVPSDDSPSLWFDGSDATQVTLNSGNVSQWSDKSGSGFHATQSTASQQPVWSGNGLSFAAIQNMKTSVIINFDNWTSDRTTVALVSYGSSVANTILHRGALGSAYRDEQMLVSSGKLLIHEYQIRAHQTLMTQPLVLMLALEWWLFPDLKIPPRKREPSGSMEIRERGLLAIELVVSSQVENSIWVTIATVHRIM
jgi:hypothetical protein